MIQSENIWSEVPYPIDNPHGYGQGEWGNGPYGDPATLGLIATVWVEVS